MHIQQQINRIESKYRGTMTEPYLELLARLGKRLHVATDKRIVGFVYNHKERRMHNKLAVQPIHCVFIQLTVQQEKQSDKCMIMRATIGAING